MIIANMEKTLAELEEMSEFITTIKNNDLLSTEIRIFALRVEIDLLNLELSIMSECKK